MFILKKTKVLYCDVDKTLIMWEVGDKWHPHEAHIRLLEQFKEQGHGIVIWSAGGYEWAVKAIALLAIEHLVDIVVNKPDWWVDDKPVTDFMPENTHIFLPDLDAPKQTFKRITPENLSDLYNTYKGVTK